MRKWWIAACALAVLGCRAEDRDRALGTERGGAEGRTAEPSGAEPKPGQLGEPDRPGELGAPRPGEPKSELGAPPGPAQPGQTGTAQAVDRVLAKALELSQAEVDMAKLAQKRASSPEIKALAGKLVSDHQQDVDSIRKLASDKKIDLSAVSAGDPIARASKAAHEEKMNALRGLTGTELDAAFLAPQSEMHTMFVKIAEEGQKVSDDPQIDAVFTTLAGHAKDHQTEIQRLLPKECGGKGTAPAPGGATPEEGHGKQGGGRPGGGLEQRPGGMPEGGEPSHGTPTPKGGTGPRGGGEAP